MKEAIEANCALPVPARRVIRDCSQLNWKGLFNGLGYNLTYSSKPKASPRIGRVTVQVLKWQAGKKFNTKPITPYLTIGVLVGDTATNAQIDLFEFMGTAVSKAITPSSFKILKDGPGDYCIVAPGYLTGDEKGQRVIHKVWFVRDNIGVVVASPDDTDLLPFAKLADRVIRSCPEGATGKAAK